MFNFFFLICKLLPCRTAFYNGLLRLYSSIFQVRKLPIRTFYPDSRKNESLITLLDYAKLPAKSQLVPNPISGNLIWIVIWYSAGTFPVIRLSRHCRVCRYRQSADLRLMKISDQGVRVFIFKISISLFPIHQLFALNCTGRGFLLLFSDQFCVTEFM